jgi:Tol biopolymer transport system component
MFRIVSTALVILFAFAGSDAHSASSPSVYNGRIAFSVSTGIASMNPDGSGQWGVELQVGDTQPAWSPDGTKLAVVTHWRRNGIELLQPNGDALGMLTNDGGDNSPAWSPDGTTVAFTNGPNLWLVSADGTSRRQLTNDTDGNAARPTWAPDGKTIAFSAYREDTTEGYTQNLYTVDVASGKEKQLPITGVSYASSPAWSSDGKTILFAGYAGGNQGIFGANPDGSSVRPISTTGNYETSPAWSPDGSRIAFYNDRQIWVMNADGSDARQLANGDYGSDPAWQPLAPPPAGSGCTLWGTSANDLLVGTDGSDVICGLAGNDTIVGLGGSDTLRGNSGDDYLAGGLGHDIIVGDDGNDTIDARNGSSDIVFGGTGVDTAIISGLRGTFMSSIEQPRVDANIAAWMPATADQFEPTNPPQLAFDGLIQDWWNAGSYPPHWIDVDLQYPRTIARMQLIAPALPFNGTVLVLGRSDSSQPYRLLYTFTGPTSDLQEVDYAPSHPWTNVRDLRLQVNSAVGWNGWVSLRELEVYAPAQHASKKAKKKKR